MPLQSKLLGGDPKLESCLVSDAAHVTLGSVGEHVSKIQLALNRLIDAGLKFDGNYGPVTAKAVMGYKNDPSRRILQLSQTTADNIVGKRTIASLDDEMLVKERIATELRIVVIRPARTPIVSVPVVRRSAFSLGFAFPATFANIIIDPSAPTQSVRLKPREFAQLLVKNPGGDTVVNCVNNPPPNGDIKEKVSLLWDPDFSQIDRLSPEPKGLGVSNSENEAFGGRHFLFRKVDTALNIDGFRPGDAVVTATNSAGQKTTLQVIVRANSAGPVKGGPLTKLALNSKFFSAALKDGGEVDPHDLGHGRPVNPNRGGRLINLGGEQETPEFEDYQVTLGFSGYRRPFFDNNKPIFRPMFDDPDTRVGLGPASASHICMRGNPLKDGFIKAIRAIAKPGCIFTISGSSTDILRAVSEFGQPLEKDIQKDTAAFRL